MYIGSKPLSHLKAKYSIISMNQPNRGNHIITLLEGYRALVRWNKYPSDEIKVNVFRPYVLSPSKKLLQDYKEAGIDWAEYEVRFHREIKGNPVAMKKLREIKELSEERDMRLICYEKNPPCHRFLLIEMINEL